MVEESDSGSRKSRVTRDLSGGACLAVMKCDKSLCWTGLAPDAQRSQLPSFGKISCRRHKVAQHPFILSQKYRRGILSNIMAGSKYAYVKSFELPDPLLQNTFIVLRIDGHAFHR